MTRPRSATSTVGEFRLGAPGTGAGLHLEDDQFVDGDGNRYHCDDGVWHFITPDRLEEVDAFAADYAAVRHHEHRTPPTAEAVAALPYHDLSGDLTEMWSHRAASFDRFRSELAGLDPSNTGLMVDVGAGCGWLAARMAASGWAAAAVDVTVDGGDGLSAARLHKEDLFLARAEMTALPFAGGSVDLVVFNASLHYAPDVGSALGEAIRITKPGGILAIIDSPTFNDPTAGVQMVEEFACATRENHNIEPARHFGPGFVTERDIERFKKQHPCSVWVRVDERPGVTGKLRSMIGARRAGREIANRPLIIAKVADEPATKLTGKPRAKRGAEVTS